MKALFLLTVAVLVLAFASPIMGANTNSMGYTTSYDTNGNIIYRDAQGRQISKDQYYNSMYMYGMDGNRMYDNTYPYNYNYKNNYNNMQYQQQQRLMYPYNYNTMSQATTPYYTSSGK